MGDLLQRQILQLALGAAAGGVREVHTGSAAFQQKYMRWAQNPGEIRLSPALETALLNWKSVPPLVKRTSEGLTIELRGARLSKPADLQALVQLGELFLRKSPPFEILP